MLCETLSCLFFFFWVGSGGVAVLGFELRPLQARQHSGCTSVLPLEPHPSPIFFTVFQLGLYTFWWTSVRCHPPTYAFSVTKIIGMCHHPWLVLWDKVLLNIFALAGLESQPSYPFLWSDWNYRHEPLCSA